MKTSTPPAHPIGWRATGMAVLFLAVGATPGGAETFYHGGSTATIEQGQGSGPSNTQVTRSGNTQTLVTQDGSSTDIVIQGGASPYPTEEDRAQPPTSTGRFDRRSIWERFSGETANAPHAVMEFEYEASSASEELKRRMLERIQRPF